MKKQLTLYAYALAIFVLAVIGRVLIDFVVPERLPYITFFPAVFLAAYRADGLPSRRTLMPIDPDNRLRFELMGPIGTHQVQFRRARKATNADAIAATIAPAAMMRAASAVEVAFFA
jgi:hypothetical protein